VEKQENSIYDANQNYAKIEKKILLMRCERILGEDERERKSTRLSFDTKKITFFPYFT
jgi:hypothetical protein